MNFEISPF